MNFLKKKIKLLITFHYRTDSNSTLSCQTILITERKPQHSGLETDSWPFQADKTDKQVIFSVSEQGRAGSCSGCQGSVPLKAVIGTSEFLSGAACKD